LILCGFPATFFGVVFWIFR